MKGGDNFSLLELGSWSGLYSLELSARYPRSTIVAIEPNRTVWSRHAALARRRHVRGQQTLCAAVLHEMRVPLHAVSARAHVGRSAAG